MSANLQHKAHGESTPLAFFSRQLLQHIPPIPKSYNLSGQVALVTGSNVGLGLESARQLLALGLSHLIIAVRSQTKGDAAAEKLRREFPEQKVEVSIVDMASYESIVEFAKWCQGLERLDIAILNAGVDHNRFELVKTTMHETTFQINYLSTALLSLLLIPILREKRGSTSPARLSIVGSDTVYWASWKASSSETAFEAMDNESYYNRWGAYKKSKLLLLMFADELSRRVSADEVIVNVANPGACKGTELGVEGRGKLQAALFWVVSSIIGRSIADGARQYVDAVTVKGAETHGSFVSDGTIKPFPVMMYEEEGKTLQKAAWQETMKEFAFMDVKGWK